MFYEKHTELDTVVCIPDIIRHHHTAGRSGLLLMRLVISLAHLILMHVFGGLMVTRLLIAVGISFSLSVAHLGAMHRGPLLVEL